MVLFGVRSLFWGVVATAKLMPPAKSDQLPAPSESRPRPPPGSRILPVAGYSSGHRLNPRYRVGGCAAGLSQARAMGRKRDYSAEDKARRENLSGLSRWPTRAEERGLFRPGRGPKVFTPRTRSSGLHRRDVGNSRAPGADRNLFKREVLGGVRVNKLSYPAWIRTRNTGTKIPCVTSYTTG